MGPEITGEYVENHHPAVADQLRQQGAEDERARLRSIEELKVPGHEHFVAQLKWRPDATADTVARAIIEADAVHRAARLDALKSDEQALEAPEPLVTAMGDAVSVDARAAAFVLAAGK